jgi:serine/threonine protein kinase
VSTPSAPPPPEPGPLRPGDLFGRYRVGELVGRGAFACVYRAQDLRLGRGVALKVFARVGESDDKLRRFWREAELSRALVHPHTVRVYEYGIERDGVPFIALELLDGESLHQRMRRSGPFSVEETRRIIRCVLKSLMEAHAYGMVHRDIKASNVFLCRFAGEPDFVKVLDFGIAKVPRQDLTAHGWLVGTPAYMAPEQITSVRLGPRADLYSLGLLMVTMLTGAPLLQGETRDILKAQVSPEPLPLPREVVKSPLYALIRRATQKDPARRYASAAEMLADLEGGLPLDRTLDATLGGLGVSPPSERAAERGSSVAPVAFPSPESRPEDASRRAPRFFDWKLVASLVFAVSSILFASSMAGLAQRPTKLELAHGLSASDPTAAAAFVRMRAEQRGFTIESERAIAPSIVELTFSHPAMLGVIRVQTLRSERDARWWAEQVSDEKGRASVRRGRRVLSVWAAPKGHTGFELPTSKAALEELTPSSP